MILEFVKGISVEFDILIFVFGLVFGSFLNVLILRLPENKSLFYPPSSCSTCNNKLKFYHNIPVISWLVLGGKCGFCKSKISCQYPLIELIVGFIFLYTIDIYSLEAFIYSIFLALSFSLLFALCIIDVRYLAVPSFTLMLTLIFALIYTHSLDSFKNALLFAGGAYLLKALIESIMNIKANSEEECVQVMGEADIEIMALIGALLGVLEGFVAIFLGALVSLPVFMYLRLKGKENIQVPFIPFLSIGLAIAWFFPTISEFCLDYVR